MKRIEAAPPAFAFAISDAEKREISLRVWAWDAPGESTSGPVMLRKGALEGTDPERNVLRMDHTDPPIGRMVSFEESEEGAEAIYRVSTTARGDEALHLIGDGIYRGASIAFMGDEAKPVRLEDGRMASEYASVEWMETSLTWIPAHPGTAILSVHSKQGEPNVADEPIQGEAQVITASGSEVITKADVMSLFSQMEERFAERSRQSIDLPAGMDGKPRRVLDMGRWASFALRLIDGERIPESELRAFALADVISTGNAGAVPKAFREELRTGFIDRARPFLESTREVPAGDVGLTFTIPRLLTKPTVAKQATEKAELSSTAPTMDTVDYTAETYGGAADLSLQLLKRSSPAFLGLFLELLAEAYAVATDDAALDKLLAVAAVVEGGIFNPASPSFGGAFTNAMAVNKALLPDRIWLSTAGLAAFIDAKEPTGGGGRPLYPGLVNMGSISTSGGNGPLPMTLTPVHVPAMDDEAPDVMIGPSRGFVWAEDGTYVLQADNVAKFGRDVSLAGMIWLMPLYPAAFTTYTLT